jgi:heme-degrading monooxygenase HmoA
MIAVIFEVKINDRKQEQYLQIAEQLRGHLAEVKGFISIERFASLAEDGKLCSLSFWEDEASIKQWREFELHRLAQAKGKSGIFADFRIRVAEVVRDYGMEERREAPE